MQGEAVQGEAVQGEVVLDNMNLIIVMNIDLLATCLYEHCSAACVSSPGHCTARYERSPSDVRA